MSRVVVIMHEKNSKDPWLEL
eukprot:COSAG05_NODE_17495_length_324_cov_0.920000_1_plen_20_part_10